MRTNKKITNTIKKTVIILLVLVLVLTGLTLTLSQSSTPPKFLYLSVEKPYYEIGEKVTLIITADNLADYELSITSEHNLYKYSGELPGSIDFYPKEEGKHIAELANKTSHSVADSLEFIVGTHEVSSENIEVQNQSNNTANNTAFITTDKQEYVLGETVSAIIKLPEPATDNFNLYYEYQGFEQRFMGDLSAEIRFVPQGIGTHYLVLMDRNGNEIERYSFKVIESTGTEQFPTTYVGSPGQKEVLWLRNSKGEKQNAIIKLSNETNQTNKTNRVKLAEILVQSKAFDKIVLQDLELTQGTQGELPSLGIDEVPKNKVKISKKNIVKAFALDPTELNFTNGTLTGTATGNELWKCKDWDFANQGCLGTWVKIADLTPGQEYEIEISPEDPGYAEVIEITKALHLDENKTFISNIYPEVKEKDNIWSEPVLKNEYVRVKFEKPLNSGNDITIYVRNNQSLNTSIEVYYFNSTEKITQSLVIAEERYYKVYLSDMQESHDTFDLKVVSTGPETAYLEFDHVIDPTFIERYNATANISGHIQSSNCSGNGTNTVLMNSSNSIYTGNNDTGNGTEYRMFISLDTSPIPDDAIINSASFYVYLNSEDLEGAETIDVYACSYGASLENADFQNTTYGYNHGSIFNATSGTSQYHSVSLNVSGNNVSKTGYSQYCLLISTGCNDTIDLVDTLSTTPANQPYITINWTAAQDNPPNITSLNYPENDTNITTSSPVDFNFTVTDDWNITACTLYTNVTSSWAANESISTVTNNSQNIISASMPDGNLLWNIRCEDNNEPTGYGWYEYNYTVHIDATPPTSNQPNNASHEYNTIAKINWTLTDNIAPGKYIIYRNGTIQNDTTPWNNNTNLNISINTTTLGTWNYTIWYNDSLGNNGTTDTVII
ncbi:hypothetical protein KY348_07340, partial [Candidatus Woesearchaeota archaeon]|nr:hypothetical protein [Candidatus Woesearchaeota archaeon]